MNINKLAKLDGSSLTLSEIKEIVFNDKKIEIDKKSLKKVKDSFNFLSDYSQKNVVYGLNTGLGPMAKHFIDDSLISRLQKNLIRSHALGLGNNLPSEFVKTTLLVRLNTLTKGYSGVDLDVLRILTTLVNKNILPIIPEHGSVGASGDLVQLAHVALALIGEGEVSHKNKILKTESVFKKEKIKPLEVKLRDGLAMINGTSTMSSIAAINLLRADKLYNYALLSSAFLYEITQSSATYISEELSRVRPHKGQVLVAEKLRNILKSSQLIDKQDLSYKVYKELKTNKNKADLSTQEIYSIRCAPQVLGPIFESIEQAKEVVEIEINSVNDNPVIYSQKGIYHGGNFHGDYISFEMDKLKIAITKLSILSERRLNFLMNDKLNKILPPFVNLGVLGVNFGLQGLQFVATSTVAENQTLSNPMSIHSITTNNDNQDIVSMGTNAALMTKKVIENAFEVMAIEIITIVQAIEYLNVQDKVSSKTKKMYDAIRIIVPPFEEDIVMYPYVNEVKNFIINHENN